MGAKCPNLLQLKPKWPQGAGPSDTMGASLCGCNSLKQAIEVQQTQVLDHTITITSSRQTNAMQHQIISGERRTPQCNSFYFCSRRGVMRTWSLQTLLEVSLYTTGRTKGWDPRDSAFCLHFCFIKPSCRKNYRSIKKGFCRLIECQSGAQFRQPPL